MPGSELARRLFVPQERWGWEYVDPGTDPHPDRDRPPVWHEPPPPDVKNYEDDLEKRMRRLPKILFVSTLLIIFGLLRLIIYGTSRSLAFVNGGWIPASFAVLWAGLRIGQVVSLKRKIAQEKAEWRARRGLEWERHQSAVAGWRAAVESHEAADWSRREAAPLFYPLAPEPTASRTDVIGGTRDGWASLLATLGSSVLASGDRILLLDLSERGIGNGLTELAGADFPVTVSDLPTDIGRLGLLHDVDPENVAELLADATGPVRQGGDDPALRTLDAEILAAVSTCLDLPLTFTRMACGLRILEGDQGSDTAILSPAERGAIADRVGVLGRSERTQDEIHYLRVSLERLAGREENAPVSTPQPLWPERGLRVIATSSRDTTASRKELVDRVLFQVVLHHLRRRRNDGSRDLLVVAGADRMGLPALERMARYADNAGVRLVNLFERLIEDTERLIGSGGSATLIMQLGNAKEAEAAAEFVGRGHKFVFSQITRQVGSSLTSGTSTSAGGSVTVSETEGKSGSRGKTGTGGWHSSVTVSQSEFWQNTESLSVTDSRQDGAVMQRVYEFSVEPTQIQRLPPTAFVLVDSSLGDRRAAFGDCNPGIVLLPRVASSAHEAIMAAHQQSGPPLAIEPGADRPGREVDDTDRRPDLIDPMQP